MVHILYAVCAITCALVVLILPIRFATNADKNDPIIRAFLRLIYWTAIFCTGDALWGLIASDVVTNDTALFAISIVFHTTAAFTPCVWLYFILRYLGRVRYGKVFGIISLLIFLAEVAMIIANVTTHDLFYVDETGHYASTPTRNILFYAQYATYVLIAIISIARAFFTRNEMIRKNSTAVFLFVLAPILLGIYQMYYPDAPAYSIGYTLGCCIIYSTVVFDMLTTRIHEKAAVEQASKAKTDFLFNMSHDIRTPMNAIIGFTTLAQKYSTDQQRVEDYLRKIEVSGNHLLNLINEVLDMSRIEAGKLRSELKVVHIVEAAQNLVTICRETASAKDVKLSLITHDIQHPLVMADVLHVNQVIMNIMGNAIKYTMSGGSVVYTVQEVESERADLGCYRFTIQDTGIGMSEEFLSRIFDSFAREESKATKGIQGTGLGMSIVKRLVDYMDGRIDIKSQLGEGTTVTVQLYLKQCADAAAPTSNTSNTANTVNADHSAAPHTYQGTVLLVEDNDLNREICTEILKELGVARVEEAVNGLEAVDMVRQHAKDYYALVLMDVQMPFMNGYDATREIRRFSKVPIVALSANAFEEDRRTSIAAGMNDHLAKPLEVAALSEVLKRYL